MGSSAKKKREKKKDFQKPKLKVGKARPKPANTTETSFRSKGIVLTQQLDIDAPTRSAKFLQQLSLLSSRTDTQRRDALAYLTNHVASLPAGTVLPATSSTVLNSICPLILDGTGSVRNQLLKLFQALPSEDVRDNVIKILPYMRAGMTHLSRDIRVSAVDFLSFLTKVAGPELVSSIGGWFQTLECFTTVLGWRSPEASKWSSTKASFSGDVKSTVRIMQVLAEFLQAGLVSDDHGLPADNSMALEFPLCQTDSISIPTKSNAYAYLNLFGASLEIEKQMLEDREDRWEAYVKSFQPAIVSGIDESKKEGGELGRAAGSLVKVLERAEVG
jgi:pre-rRNA-processing protein IPI1